MTLRVTGGYARDDISHLAHAYSRLDLYNTCYTNVVSGGNYVRLYVYARNESRRASLWHPINTYSSNKCSEMCSLRFPTASGIRLLPQLWHELAYRHLPSLWPKSGSVLEQLRLLRVAAGRNTNNAAIKTLNVIDVKCLVGM